MTAALIGGDVRVVAMPDPVRSPRRAIGARIVLVAGCAVTIALSQRLGDPSTSLHADPDLGRLLRGMAVVKALAVAAAIVLIVWRFGRPVTLRIGSAYTVGAWILAGATTSIRQLSWIVPAAALFHLGLVTLLVAAWRDEALPWSRAMPHRRVGADTPAAHRPQHDAAPRTT